MSRHGDDLIRSLKEALAHAKGDGPGTVHPPASSRDLESGDAPADDDDIPDGCDLIRPSEC